MRLALTLTVLVLAAAVPVAASDASVRTPPKVAAFHVIQFSKTSAKPRLASCSAHTRTGKHVAKVVKKILPVACEQPPRSRLGLDLARAAATAASALVP